MTSTLRMSFLLGIFVLLHHFNELVEQVAAVLRSRCALGVVLHREDLFLGAFHPLGRVVQQIHVGQPQGRSLERFDVDRKAVVLARDFYLARIQTLHRVVASAVAEFHLEGLRAVGQRHHLMAHADAEYRQAAFQRPDLFDDGLHVHRVARAVRQEDSVGPERQYLLHRRVVGHHRHVAALGVQTADDVVFDAAVDSHHVVAVVGRAREPAFLAAHPRHHVVRQFARAQAFHRFLVRRGGVRNHHFLAPLVADYPRQTAGVDARDARNAHLLEHLVQRARIAEVRRDVVVLAHDQSADGRELGFVVFFGRAVVADQRIGHHHRLARVRGVGDDFLVAHHRGVEDDFVNRLLVGSEPVAVEFAAVFEYDFLGVRFHIVSVLFAISVFVILRSDCDEESSVCVCSLS